ncbi:Kazal-type serine protease inhibitor family protein [Algoriphagus aestuarii]|nr:Kazal-type serine protease inhibitor family protein [Algoriphagus aestuarii]
MKILKLIFSLLIFFLAFACENEEPPKNCIDPDRIRNGACTLDYRPVCGCDGKTYGNACAADLAGVTSWTEGKCR